MDTGIGQLELHVIDHVQREAGEDIRGYQRRHRHGGGGCVGVDDHDVGVRPDRHAGLRGEHDAKHQRLARLQLGRLWHLHLRPRQGHVGKDDARHRRGAGVGQRHVLDLLVTAGPQRHAQVGGTQTVGGGGGLDRNGQRAGGRGG